jgi:hypothetical protein
MTRDVIDLQGTARRRAAQDLAAEVRAVEEGHRAFVQEGGWIKVVSDTRRDVSYAVTYEHIPTRSNAIHFHCTCPSGVHRPHLLVPCKHAALAGRRLERENIAIWHDGIWWVHPDLLAAAPAPRPTAKPNVSALCD